MASIHHDYSEVTRLDDHFATLRAQQLALEAAAAQAEQAARMRGLRNERIRKIGVAALLVGCGVGVGCFGASFLVKPITWVGPERVVTRDVPGPERIVKVPEYVTPKEHDFIERPEYKSAKLKGHLVADADGLIRFDTGDTFVPLKTDPTTRLLEQDKEAMYDDAPYLVDQI